MFGFMRQLLIIGVARMRSYPGNHQALVEEFFKVDYDKINNSEQYRPSYVKWRKFVSLFALYLFKEYGYDFPEAYNLPPPRFYARMDGKDDGYVDDEDKWTFDDGTYAQYWTYREGNAKDEAHRRANSEQQTANRDVVTSQQLPAQRDEESDRTAVGTSAELREQ